MSRETIDAAFTALLDEAPKDRLLRLMPPTPVADRAWRRWRGLAAGFAVGVALTGATWLAVARFVAPDSDDWREAVVDYMDLYTTDTFAAETPDPARQKRQLDAASAKIGATLKASDLAIDGQTFKSAQLLGYEGAPLVEIAYTDASGEPALFCILADGGETVAPRQQSRGRYSLVSWGRDGKSFLVIARAPARVAEIAGVLEGRKF